MKNTRRDFIKYTGLAGFALGTSGIDKLNAMTTDKTSGQEITFISPIDGDMLNSYDGKEVDGSLQIQVRFQAPRDMNLKVNGKGARFENGMYIADVQLKDYENRIEVVDIGSGKKTGIVVYRLRNIIDRYRLSLDDNIWFLKDISVNSGIYKSIFENPYLGFLREIHNQYGTRIHLNIYFQTDGFKLSQMSQKYKGEWKDNAGWLRLSFHALQNDPDKPYIHAGYDEVKRDCEMVNEQIRRFAGEELMGPVTTLHWGEATVEGCRALRDSGYTGLAGYFNLESEPVSYYLDMEKRKHINNRYIWRDNHEGIIFSRMATVINTLKLDEIVPRLDGLRSNAHKLPYADLMIHEEYFYPFYHEYQPDFRQKVHVAVKWAADHGYQPAFLSECIFA